ncbi:MarR family EPS-associated transcriptional regulator [Amylibacter sp.]|nr:MarR family EPS-associated transcriptional regulator [Amylibacter sp.]
MASRRKEHQEDARLRVMQMINQSSSLTSREIAQKLRISNGSAYYLVISLIDKGLVKLSNFNETSKKMSYCYLLTPKGIREKSLLTHKFLIRKKKEYEALKEEIRELEQDAGLCSDTYNNE